MKLKIKAFGVAREIIGSNNIVLEVSEAMNVQEMKILLFQTYPRLESLSSMFVAINNAYADEGATLHEDDEIALIPPVGGG